MSRVTGADTLWALLELGDPEVGAWVRQALCAQTDPEVFFPDKGGDPRPAKAVCAVCPVASACLAYAVPRPELYGIWGGTSPREREALRRQRRLSMTRGVAA